MMTSQAMEQTIPMIHADFQSFGSESDHPWPNLPALSQETPDFTADNKCYPQVLLRGEPRVPFGYHLALLVWTNPVLLTSSTRRAALLGCQSRIDIC